MKACTDDTMRRVLFAETTDFLLECLDGMTLDECDSPIRSLQNDSHFIHSPDRSIHQVFHFFQLCRVPLPFIKRDNEQSERCCPQNQDKKQTKDGDTKICKDRLSSPYTGVCYSNRLKTRFYIIHKNYEKSSALQRHTAIRGFAYRQLPRSDQAVGPASG